MARQPLLEVTGLSAGYRDLQAIWDVNLTVYAGEITAIFGRNGAGKSTTLLAIAGLLRRLGGQVQFDGTAIGDLPAYGRTRLGLALVRENKRIFRRRTVEENLLLGGFTMPRRKRRQAVQRAYEQFPMLGAKRRLAAGGLSGGQQQMLAIAQALMPEPRLVMLDEPSAGLAPVIVDEVFGTLAWLKGQGVGVLLVEQLVDQASRIADRVVLLDQGRVMSDVSGSTGAHLEEFRDVYLGRARK